MREHVKLMTARRGEIDKNEQTVAVEEAYGLDALDAVLDCVT
jgi:hypothetical protein